MRRAMQMGSGSAGTALKVIAVCFIIGAISTMGVSAQRAESIVDVSAVQSAADAVDPVCAQRVSFINDAWSDNLVINCNSTTTAATISADLEHYNGNFAFLPSSQETDPVLWRCKLHAYILPGCITFNAWANLDNQAQLLSPCSFCAYKANHYGLFINTASCAPSGEANWQKIADWGNCYHN